ncbi:flagellar protein FliT [Bacillus sp. WMMC1349]|uniref:flagellar protein FliT n=1 Tax=Bacillus sp. WMMC1349 TaxID=2736254 RepID=UPI0015550CAF|nr:flagellar protein FliT [Bacillus sp. WMMC1349]NPC94305.1 flagellar protein FliT [Bacillus sp. WMMC1349]
MNRIKLLLSETENILSEIKDIPESDELLQRIEDYLEKREGLIDEIKPPLSHEEKLQLEQVVKMEPLIMTELKRLKEDIKKELIQVKKKRALHQTYLTPYQNVTIDGTYYDKRK